MAGLRIYTMSGFTNDVKDLEILRIACRDGDMYTTMLHARTRITKFMEANLFTDEYVVYLRDHDREIVKETIDSSDRLTLTAAHLRLADYLLIVPAGRLNHYELETTEDVEAAYRVMGVEKTLAVIVSGCTCGGSPHVDTLCARKFLKIAPNFPLYAPLQNLSPAHKITMAILTGKPEYAEGVCMTPVEARLCSEVFPEMIGFVSVRHPYYRVYSGK